MSSKNFKQKKIVKKRYNLPYFILLFLILPYLYSCEFSNKSILSNQNNSLTNDQNENDNRDSELSITPKCLTDLPELIKEKLEDYSPARKDDFVQSIRNYDQENVTKDILCSIINLDINKDGLNDYAILSISPDQSSFRFLLLINQGEDKFASVIVKDYPTINQGAEGIIYTSMSYKSEGELGIIQREYSPIKPETKEGITFIASPAIKLWKPITNNKTNLPLDLNLETLSYCSEVFYWSESQIKTVTVCD